MPDPILTPLSVDRVYEVASKDEYHGALDIAALCDSHESLRELAGRLARALRSERANVSWNWQDKGCGHPYLCVCAGDEIAALLATPAVQSLIAASKEGNDA